MFNSDVDLTNNRIFDKHARTIKPVSISVQETYSQPGIVFTGDIHTINIKKLTMTFADRQTCDRCGKVLSPFGYSTLCPECESLMDKSEPKKRIKVPEPEKPWFLV